MPEERAVDIYNLTMTWKTDTNSVIISGIVPRSDKLNERASKVTAFWDMNVIMWEIFVFSGTKLLGDLLGNINVPNWFLDKTCKKGLNRKSEHYYKILHIKISLLRYQISS